MYVKQTRHEERLDIKLVTPSELDSKFKGVEDESVVLEFSGHFWCLNFSLFCLTNGSPLKLMFRVGTNEEDAL